MKLIEKDNCRVETPEIGDIVLYCKGDDYIEGIIVYEKEENNNPTFTIYNPEKDIVRDITIKNMYGLFGKYMFVYRDKTSISMGELKNKVDTYSERIRDNEELTGVIKPNTDYRGRNIEVFVNSKKNWFSLIRTTNKMAFFDGGRCGFNKITCIRKG